MKIQEFQWVVLPLNPMESGIAVAIGAMVDASIILVENVHKKLDVYPAIFALWKGRRLSRKTLQSPLPSVGAEFRL